jgi:hypothetical protein
VGHDNLRPIKKQRGLAALLIFAGTFSVPAN